MTGTLLDRPTNRFLVREPDRRMPRVLITVLLIAAVLVVVLSMIGWPRLKSTSIHYDLIKLRGELDELAQTERQLRLELERERSPELLAHRAAELGLVPPPAPRLEQAALPEGHRQEGAS